MDTGLKMLICRKCGFTGQINDFVLDFRYKDAIAECHNCHNRRVRAWRLRNPEKEKAYRRKAYLLHLVKRRESGKMGHKERKIRVLTYYGNNKLTCVVCGETRLPCLSIDHINGGGLAHRRSLGISSGSMFYAWLENNNYPKGFQTLCMNCQYMKRANNREDYIDKETTRR